ncbi:hypothetical protein CANARDRAFT_27162 [[Candida] arabinofermentans NRRL YB-2248]|uniref:BAR domain-containing protein n=1 Tax=[Candida] arabinofermentans NRRL YB-2248 TaxID=983967 RepID=A0A1E4T4U1_9ASCO|nr:hypothetical protein CANARDRAFT_27162 [[Candida] arabinofermentans NRRL YB-2248]
MSLRGVKKALYRTPHHFMGRRSGEDELIKSWIHDLQTASAGLEFLESQEKMWNRNWTTILDNLLSTIDTFKRLHEPVNSGSDADENYTNYDDNEIKYDENEEFSNITIREIKLSEKLSQVLYDQVTQRVENGRETFIEQCSEMRDHLRASLKLITKRNHKKIDCDMHYNATEKVLHTKNFSDKDKAKLEQSKTQLSEARIVFLDLDAKVKFVIPQVLETLSEFINKLTIKVYYQNLDIYQLVTRNISKFASTQGLVVSLTDLTYEGIISNWREQSTQARNKLESMEMLKDYKQFRDQTLLDKTTHQVNQFTGQVIESTLDFTNSLYTKTFYPNQKLNIRTMKIENPVKPFSRNGMFVTAMDPIKFILDELTGPYTDYQEDISEIDSSHNNIESPTRKNTSQKLSAEQKNTGSHIPESEQELKYEQKSSDTQEMQESLPSVTDDFQLKPLSLKRSNIESQPGHIGDSLETTPRRDLSSRTSSRSGSTTLHSPSIKNEYNRVLSSGTANRSSAYAESILSSPKLEIPTDTFRYTSVSMSAIEYSIKDLITKPSIDRAPILSALGQRDDEEDDIKAWVAGRSSITANLFAASVI